MGKAWLASHARIAYTRMLPKLLPQPRLWPGSFTPPTPPRPPPQWCLCRARGTYNRVVRNTWEFPKMRLCRVWGWASMCFLDLAKSRSRRRSHGHGSCMVRALLNCLLRCCKRLNQPYRHGSAKMELPSPLSSSYNVYQTQGFWMIKARRP